MLDPIKIHKGCQNITAGHNANSREGTQRNNKTVQANLGGKQHKDEHKPEINQPCSFPSQSLRKASPPRLHPIPAASALTLLSLQLRYRLLPPGQTDRQHPEVPVPAVQEQEVPPIPPRSKVADSCGFTLRTDNNHPITQHPGSFSSWIWPGPDTERKSSYRLFCLLSSSSSSVPQWAPKRSRWRSYVAKGVWKGSAQLITRKQRIPWMQGT